SLARAAGRAGHASLDARRGTAVACVVRAGGVVRHAPAGTARGGATRAVPADPPDRGHTCKPRAAAAGLAARAARRTAADAGTAGAAGQGRHGGAGPAAAVVRRAWPATAAAGACFQCARARLRATHAAGRY